MSDLFSFACALVRAQATSLSPEDTMITVLCCQCDREVPDEPAARYCFDVSGIPFFLCNQCCDVILSQWWAGEPLPAPRSLPADKEKP